MFLIKQGKTKDVYRMGNGNILLKFKDTITGDSQTGASDPGGNRVVGSKAGVGNNALKVTKYYFELLKEKNVPTHYVRANIEANELEVLSVTTFGGGLECIYRFIATGSFFRRFGQYCKDGDALNRGDGLFEATLKDDAREDPPVTQEILDALGLITPKHFALLKQYTKEIAEIVRDDLKEKGAELYDIKFEFGLDQENRPILIDEISAGNMRAFKNSKKLSYDQLSALILS